MNTVFDVIFTSDLIKTIDSAEIAFKKHNRIKDSRLRKCNYGDMMENQKSWLFMEHIDIPFPNGESLKDVEERMSIRSFFYNKKVKK